MIREFTIADLPYVRAMHHANGLPENCFPDLTDPIMLVKLVVEKKSKPMMATFLKGTAELYLVMDHKQGTPQERWDALVELTGEMKRRAYLAGLNEMSCWVPPEIEKSFKKRLKQLGFEPSKWQCYTMSF